MTWKPTQAQLNVIADVTMARLPLDGVVSALGVSRADYLAWRTVETATAVLDEFAERPAPLESRDDRSCQASCVATST